MRKFKDVIWTVPECANGGIASWEAVDTALLMDIRDQLQKLNAVFECPNFLMVPTYLKTIEKNSRKPKRRVKS